MSSSNVPATDHGDGVDQSITSSVKKATDDMFETFVDANAYGPGTPSKPPPDHKKHTELPLATNPAALTGGEPSKPMFETPNTPPENADESQLEWSERENLRVACEDFFSACAQWIQKWMAAGWDGLTGTQQNRLKSTLRPSGGIPLVTARLSEDVVTGHCLFSCLGEGLLVKYLVTSVVKRPFFELAIMTPETGAPGDLEESVNWVWRSMENKGYHHHAAIFKQAILETLYQSEAGSEADKKPSSRGKAKGMDGIHGVMANNLKTTAAHVVEQFASLITKGPVSALELQEKNADMEGVLRTAAALTRQIVQFEIATRGRVVISFLNELEENIKALNQKPDNVDDDEEKSPVRFHWLQEVSTLNTAERGLVIFPLVTLQQEGEYHTKICTLIKPALVWLSSEPGTQQIEASETTHASKKNGQQAKKRRIAPLVKREAGRGGRRSGRGGGRRGAGAKTGQKKKAAGGAAGTSDRFSDGNGIRGGSIGRSSTRQGDRGGTGSASTGQGGAGGTRIGQGGPDGSGDSSIGQGDGNNQQTTSLVEHYNYIMENSTFERGPGW